MLMPDVKRSTIYFDPDLRRALRMKAVVQEKSISDLVNEAVRQTLIEDAVDLDAFETRRNEPVVDFADVMKRLGIARKPRR